LATIDPAAEPVVKEKGWFTKQNIQNFLYLFISEKLPTEKMQFVIGHAYGKFISQMQPKPMALNEMRNMKEPNYSKIREVIRDPRLFGDPLMRKLAEGSEKVGIPANSFHLVHEGFWDLYCKKPATPDLSSRKLEGWVNFINIKLPTTEPPAEPTEDAEGTAEGEPVPVVEAPQPEPVKAIARVRIPFKRPEPEDPDAEKEEDADDSKSKKSSKSKKDEKKENPPLEEIEYEDKVECIPTIGENYSIYVVHQLAQRMVREHIAKEFKDFLPDLAHTDEAELLKVLERDAEQFELDFFKTFYADAPVFDFELN
jgi:hypothetical protein